MPTTAAELQPTRFNVAMVTTDEAARPEAEEALASEYDFRVLGTWNELMALVKKHPPDAILLDINLPDSTGFDVCKELKADTRTVKIPVVFHSATHDTATARSYASDLGAASFLSYPIHIDHLVSVLRGAIAQADH